MMPAIRRAYWQNVRWLPALFAAAIAVGGALAMTVILAVVAMAASALAGVPAAQVPTLLTADPVFSWFCTAAGVCTAFVAGYITANFEGQGAPLQVMASCLLTVAGHMMVVVALGSPLAPWGTALYIALAPPALFLGFYCGAPVSRPRSAGPCGPSVE
jgi:hypothetical protein